MATDYKTTLSDVFHNALHISEQQIDETIRIVLEQASLSPDENLEAMINLLIESGDSTLLSVNNDEEGATGISVNSSNNTQFSQYFDQLLSIFPDIDQNYLIQFCKKYEHFDFDQVVEDLTSDNYVKVERDYLDISEHLKQMLPNADPIYLRNQARVLAHRPPQELQEFLENAIEKNDYPTMQEYLKNKELKEDFDLYVTKFNVDEYLIRVPNPVETYQNSDRKPILTEADDCDVQFALDFLCNQFLYQRKTEIARIFSHFNRNLIKTSNKLKMMPKAFRHPRQLIELEQCKNVELLKEISFIKHEKVIRQVVKQKNERYRLALEDARLHGLLQTCACCFDDQLIPEECYFCQKGCIFCKECVKRGAEHVIGKEETTFPCLADCGSEFDYTTLQMVLDAKTFHGMWQRKQIEDIRKANIDGLETCPFCDFCMIPNEGDKIFKCANVECMAETCRLCRHKSHIPLRCNEIEYDEDVKMRTFIENKMTEALLRKCYKCSKQFYKESGCNKMTCTCGAKMCYVCGAAITDYAHFHKGACPLYTENLQQFHLDRVMKSAEAAKNELGVNEDPTKLKYDPTRGIERDIA